MIGRSLGGTDEPSGSLSFRPTHLISCMFSPSSWVWPGGLRVRRQSARRGGLPTGSDNAGTAGAKLRNTSSGPPRLLTVLQPKLSRAVLSEQTAVPDVAPDHLNAAMAGLFHDRPLRSSGN